MQPQKALPDRFLGTWRRFGTVGPVYQVVANEGSLPDGDSLMRIRVVETGEEISYRLSDVLNDPAER